MSTTTGRSIEKMAKENRALRGLIDNMLFDLAETSLTKGEIASNIRRALELIDPQRVPGPKGKRGKDE